jgi:hypothetical protein
MLASVNVSAIFRQKEGLPKESLCEYIGVPRT